MKQLKVKIMTVVLIMILFALIIPVNVFAAESNIQVVKTEKGDYIIYVEGLAKTEFEFAISQQSDATDLTYSESLNDGEGNQVAFISAADAQEGTYLYIKTSEGIKNNLIDFSQAFDKEKVEKVEKTTKRITTELTNVEERNEVIDGVRYTETVGGLKITDDNEATYYYSIQKLPVDKYSTLKELADKLNTEYEAKEMYYKIEFAKEFNKLYEEIIVDVNNWLEVENMVVKQPKDAQKDEQYVVVLKKVDKDGTVTDDVKFLVSDRKDEEEKEAGRTETRVIQETTKLPITGDSVVLFIILAVIVVALILVFIRMKKLQNKEGKN